ncbi:MAG: hypothetical protein RL115_2268 [Bacteroidota bacterium]
MFTLLKKSGSKNQAFCTLLNSGQKVQVCDATKAASSTTADIIKNVITLCLFVFTNFFAMAQTTPTPATERMKVGEQRKALQKKSVLNDIAFRNIGPVTMSGRVVDIEANPTDPTEFYVAYASGGLWHTKNNGLSFKPIFDSADVLTIGDIAVNWEKRIIWVGTGEVNSSRSSYAGLGIFKSHDNGKTWQYKGLPESHHIGKIQLHPTNENIAWVAALGHLYSANKERGVYKTTDGGNSWNHTLYVDENTGAVEMEINPANANELYAATWYRTRSAWNFEEAGASSGIYKSNDGGETWKRITDKASGFPADEQVGRIGIAIYPGKPEIIYAVVDNQANKPDTAKKDSLVYTVKELNVTTKEAFAALDNKKLDTLFTRSRLYPKYSAVKVKEWVAADAYKPTVLYDYFNVNTGFEANPIGCEVYKSENAGGTWKKVNTKEIQIFFTYGYYFAKIFVSPTNPDKVYVIGLTAQLSTDGGKTFKNIDKNNVHSDHHSLWINPKKDSHLINGNDGGVNITYDDGEVWFKANTPAVGQFYAITTDNAKPYNVYGGLQDNGVWYVPSQTGRNPFGGSGLGQTVGSENNLGGGDGMQVQVDPRDNTTVYYGSQFGNYTRSNRLNRTEGAKRVTPRHELGEMPYRYNWQSPILLSSHTPEIVYFGSNYFHRSMNRADTMIKMTNDLTNGGKPGNVPYGTLTTISESPLRFGLLYLGTDDGNIHVSKDAGQSWEKLNGTAINITSAKKKTNSTVAASNAGRIDTRNLWVSRVIASQHKEPIVYASLNGYRFDDFMPYLYVSNDYGNTWNAIGKDLPFEPINVVREDPKDENILYIGTDGGLYVSFDKGNSFMQWQAGMPSSVPIHDIAIQQRENEIVLGTHGRSLYVAKLDDVQMLRKDPEWMKKKKEKQKKEEVEKKAKQQ